MTSNDFGPVVLRVGMDGAVTRVSFAADEGGGAGALFREQIGCSWYEVMSLDDRTDMWVDEEALVAVDLDDHVALTALLNRGATLIATHFDTARPVFGVAVIAGRSGESATALDDEQLARLERLVERAGGHVSGRGPTTTLTVRVSNAHSDGHQSEGVETIDVDAFSDVEELWEQLGQITGDGHGVGNHLGYCHTVAIVDCPSRPDLVGLSNEWVGA